jgi:TonB family protein
MRNDYIISLMAHVAILAIIIIFSAGAARSNLPPLGETVSVSMFKELPKGLNKPNMPNVSVPAAAADNAPAKEEPVKLSSITKKEKLQKKKEATSTKPKNQPKETPKEPPKEEPEESGEGTSPSGSGVQMALSDGNGTGEDYANGPLGEYYLSYDFNFVTNRISQNWNNPIRSNSVISCIIYFQITKSGEIQGVTVKKSSGNELFDRYAEFAVKATKNLPPLPQSFPDNEVLAVNLTFTHRP